MNPGMRIAVDKYALPGVYSQRTLTDHASERARHDIFVGSTYIGQVSYVKRGQEYGWRPTKNARVKLTTKVEAIRRLPKYIEQIEFAQDRWAEASEAL